MHRVVRLVLKVQVVRNTVIASFFDRCEDNFHVKFAPSFFVDFEGGRADD